MMMQYDINLDEYNQTARLNLERKGDGIYEIVGLYVPPDFRGKRHGSRLMHEVLEDADMEGHTLVLVVASYGEMTNEELTKWYKRCGFEGDPHCGLMVRPPRPAKAPASGPRYNAPQAPPAAPVAAGAGALAAPRASGQPSAPYAARQGTTAGGLGRYRQGGRKG